MGFGGVFHRVMNVLIVFGFFFFQGHVRFGLCYMGHRLHRTHMMRRVISNCWLLDSVPNKKFDKLFKSQLSQLKAKVLEENMQNTVSVTRSKNLRKIMKCVAHSCSQTSINMPATALVRCRHTPSQEQRTLQNTMMIIANICKTRSKA